MIIFVSAAMITQKQCLCSEGYKMINSTCTCELPDIPFSVDYNVHTNVSLLRVINACQCNMLSLCSEGLDTEMVNSTGCIYCPSL